MAMMKLFNIFTFEWRDFSYVRLKANQWLTVDTDIACLWYIRWVQCDSSSHEWNQIHICELSNLLKCHTFDPKWWATLEHIIKKSWFHHFLHFIHMHELCDRFITCLLHVHAISNKPFIICYKRLTLCVVQCAVPGGLWWISHSPSNGLKSCFY